MIASNDNPICQKAMLYYYDYLNDPTRENIPAESLAHIDQCRFCQTELERLQITLAETESDESLNLSQKDSVAITNLSLHFEYIGVSVKCKTVQPFLPSLADPALAIRIPTPITVHLDKCRQCADDLETIQKLNLTHKQLCRLGQLFAEPPCSDHHACSEFKEAIVSVAAMVFRGIKADVLKHFSTCSDCRKLLCQRRQAIYDGLSETKIIDKELPCESISSGELFDYCIPYGIDPANDQYAKFRPALVSHVSTCPTCLGKMQELHTAVYGILERRESGIVTCCTINDSGSETCLSGSDDVYEDWPIEVQVYDNSDEIDTTKTEDIAIAASIKPKQKIRRSNIRPLAKPVAAAAAILIIALLVFNVPVAKGVSLSQIYEAIERIKNVCITSFIPQSSKPTQKRWIFENSGKMISKNNRQCVLWDVKAKSKKSKDFNTGSIVTTILDEDAISKAKKFMKPPWGLLPSENISELLPDAQWQQVVDENFEISGTNTEVYDLIWTEKLVGGSTVYKKWRFHINVRTKLPERIEGFRRWSEEQEYEFVDIIKISYPDSVEIQDIVKEFGF